MKKLITVLITVLFFLSACKKENSIEPIKSQAQDSVQAIQPFDSVSISKVTTRTTFLGISILTDSLQLKQKEVLFEIEFTIHSPSEINFGVYQPIEVLYCDNNYQILSHRSGVLYSYMNGVIRETRLLTTVRVIRKVGLLEYDMSLKMPILKYSIIRNGVDVYKSIPININTDSILF